MKASIIAFAAVLALSGCARVKAMPTGNYQTVVVRNFTTTATIVDGIEQGDERSLNAISESLADEIESKLRKENIPATRTDETPDKAMIVEGKIVKVVGKTEFKGSGFPLRGLAGFFTRGVSEKRKATVMIVGKLTDANGKLVAEFEEKDEEDDLHEAIRDVADSIASNVQEKY